MIERHDVELKPVIDETKAMLFGDAALERLDLIILKLNHLARLHIDEVIVMLIRHLFVARAAIAEVMALKDVGLFEQAQGPVDGRKADAAIHLGGTVVDRFHVGMIERFRQDTRNHATLIRHAEALFYTALLKSRSHQSRSYHAISPCHAERHSHTRYSPGMPAFENEETLRFEDQNAFAAWLQKHHNRKEPVWIVYAKKGTGIASIHYAQALEVALIWGWIDGVANRMDETFYKQRYTPRGLKSIWSKINCAKATALIESGAMQARGLAEVERAKADGRWDRAYDSPKNAKADDLEKALEANPEAKAFFETLDSQNRYAVFHRINIAVKPETRAKKVALMVEMLARGEKFYMRDPDTKKLVKFKKGADEAPTKKAATKKAATKKTATKKTAP